MFTILEHRRREVLHFNVTDHPTAAWTSQQIVEALAEHDTWRHLLTEPDGVYGKRRSVAYRFAANRGNPHNAPQPLAESIRRTAHRLRRECRKVRKTDRRMDPGNPSIDFHVEKRSSQTHESTRDPDALLARKGDGKEAKLSYNGNLLIENRNGLIVTTEVFQANGSAGRDTALVMPEQIPGGGRVTMGADKAYHRKDFVPECRNMQVTPHVAQNIMRSGCSAIDQRKTWHEGYAISQNKRKRIEEEPIRSDQTGRSSASSVIAHEVQAVLER